MKKLIPLACLALLPVALNAGIWANLDDESEGHHSSDLPAASDLRSVDMTEAERLILLVESGFGLALGTG